MATKNELDKAFEDFEAECGGSREIRKEMIGQLRKQISKCDISEYDKPMMITAKLEILKTLDGLLNSESDISLKKLKMKLARKDSESNGVVGTAVVAMLKQIRAIGEDGVLGAAPAQTPEQAKQALAERTQHIVEAGGKDAKAVTVLEGETIENDTATHVDRPEDEVEEE